MPKQSMTGGNFSTCYHCVHTDGTKAFLKVISIWDALQGPNMMRDLQQITTEYNFECDLLDQCKSMKRVVTALAFGSIKVATFPVPMNYIVFELAQSTARAEISQGLMPLDRVFQTLHHVTVGTRQLHDNRIAHQDIKPSNALIFNDGGAKLGDLGRSISGDGKSPFDALNWPGDLSYAPPEVVFGHIDSDFRIRRFATDLYLIGSLLVSLTTKASLTVYIKKYLAPNYYPRNWGGTYGSSYASALPYVELAFTEALEALEIDLHQLYPALPKQVRELIRIVRELGAPDPAIRGHWGVEGLETPTSTRYSLERYLSRFDRLATEAKLTTLRERSK